MLITCKFRQTKYWFQQIMMIKYHLNGVKCHGEQENRFTEQRALQKNLARKNDFSAW